MTRKIGISLPDDLLQEIDAWSQRAGVSRSEVLGTATKQWLAEQRRKLRVEQYVASYREQPETDEEIAATDAFLPGAFSDEP